jgi:hypothetical protein
MKLRRHIAVAPTVALQSDLLQQGILNGEIGHKGFA